MRSAGLLAIAVGAALLVATSDAPLSARPHATAREIRGTVILPDEGTPTGLYAYLTSATHRDSVPIDESSGFTIPIASAHCGALELRIDVPPGAIERRYHAAVVGFDPVGRPMGRMSVIQRPDSAGIRILLVPTRHVIQGGTYGGTMVPISLDAAFGPSWERTRYWRVARAAAAPEGYGTPVAWPENFFPIPVVLRARGGVSYSDSAAFWGAARQLELDFGRSLFQPAPDEPNGEEIWKIIVIVEPSVASAGMTFVTFNSHGAIYEATIAIRARAFFADARLVSHELMHALGFGHSSGWYSAAGPAPGTPSRATANDVAYAQLLYGLRRAHIAQGATHGILASTAEGRLAVSARASQCAR